MPVFQNERALLIYMANVQYSQGLVLAESAKSLERIERKVTGSTVDPALAQAITESKVHTDALKKALDENS